MSKQSKGKRPPGRQKTVGSEKPSTTSGPSRSLLDHECEVARRLAEDLLPDGNDYKASFLVHLGRRDFKSLASLPFPNTEHNSFPEEYALYALFRKNPKPDIGVDRVQAAYDSFFAGELSCKGTNELIRRAVAEKPQLSLAVHPRIIHGIQHFISRVLGDVGKQLHDFQALTRFGPGATTHCTSKNLTLYKKLTSSQGMTPRLAALYDPLVSSFDTFHGWNALEYGVRGTCSGTVITHGSKAATALKNAFTDRFIGSEPCVNMRHQLAAGALMRRRFLSVLHMDLSTQADKNRALVRRAQRDGKCTIDLKNASSSNALMMVRFFLSRAPGWCHLLELFRSPYMNVRGTWIELEMFSSMGNGYTFELETLLYLSIARQFDPDSQVFGDDIICSQESAADVIRCLSVFGLETNATKTFLAGSFFESCGVDVWRGLDVRPLFFKEEDEPEDQGPALLRMANAIRRFAHHRNRGYGCDTRLLRAWLYVKRQLRGKYQQSYIPLGYGDEGLLTNFDEAVPTKLRDGHEGFSTRICHQRPVERKFSGTGAMYASLYLLEGPDENWSTVSKSLRRVTMYFDGNALVPHQRSSGSVDPLGRRKCTGILALDKLPISNTLWFSTPKWDTAPDGVLALPVRDRLEGAELQTVSVQDWYDLGPWI